MKCYNEVCPQNQYCECKIKTDTAWSCAYFIKGDGVSGAPDFVEMSRRIRMFALLCKNKDAFSCEFGNEFAPKVEEYLRECWRG